MFWEETKETDEIKVTDEVVDLVFGIACRHLPVDHAYALSEALQQELPWFAGEERAAVHPVHVAGSGNGWMRPQNPDDLLHLSRRTKLVLRLPQHRVEDAKQLVGRTLTVAGHTMEIKHASMRPLSTITTLLSRYVAADEVDDEQSFLELSAQRLQAMGIRPRKMLCGIEGIIRMPDKPIRTRSLMVADLSSEESVRLQQMGLGPYRTLGCGLFIAQKSITEVKNEPETAV